MRGGGCAVRSVNVLRTSAVCSPRAGAGVVVLVGVPDIETKGARFARSSDGDDLVVVAELRMVEQLARRAERFGPDVRPLPKHSDT